MTLCDITWHYMMSHDVWCYLAELFHFRTDRQTDKHFCFIYMIQTYWASGCVDRVTNLRSKSSRVCCSCLEMFAVSRILFPLYFCLSSSNGYSVELKIVSNCLHIWMTCAQYSPWGYEIATSGKVNGQLNIDMRISLNTARVLNLINPGPVFKEIQVDMRS